MNLALKCYTQGCYTCPSQCVNVIGVSKIGLTIAHTVCTRVDVIDLSNGNNVIESSITYKRTAVQAIQNFAEHF